METNLAPVHALNRFLWSALVLNDVMNPARYKSNWIPIIPTQQIPEFNAMLDQADQEGGVPFIVYNWTTNAIGQDWYLSSDQIVYLIYSQSEKELRDISRFMTYLFKRWDETAGEVNKYVASLPYSLSNKALQSYDFKMISVSSAGGPLPIDEEGGRQEVMVSLQVTYTVDSESTEFAL